MAREYLEAHNNRQKIVSKKQEKNTPSNDQDSVEKSGGLQATLKKLIAKGKESGTLTYDELNKALPADNFSSEQIEDAMAALSDMGIQMVEGDEDVDGESSESADSDGDDDADESASGGNINSDDTGRTDDPVRMYLREMGSVELLSREGEIAIAKRIEAGRELMISGICESPLAIESIIAWYDALQKGDILLREVIDLETTYNDDPESDGGSNEGTSAPKDDLDENEEG